MNMDVSSSRARDETESTGRSLERDLLTDPNGTTTNDTTTHTTKTRQIRCRYCRSALAQEDELTHRLGPSDSTTSDPCSHYFIEEKPTWLALEINEENPHSVASVKGKLCCPHCQHKIGLYSWIGLPCSCGRWIVPAFALAKSKVDAPR